MSLNGGNVAWSRVDVLVREHSGMTVNVTVSVMVSGKQVTESVGPGTSVKEDVSVATVEVSLKPGPGPPKRVLVSMSQGGFP